MERFYYVSERKGRKWLEGTSWGFLLKVTWECRILSMFAERSFTASLLSERGRLQSFIFSVLVSPWHVKLSINIGRAGKSFAGITIPRFHADYFLISVFFTLSCQAFYLFYISPSAWLQKLLNSEVPSTSSLLRKLLLCQVNVLFVCKWL